MPGLSLGSLSKHDFIAKPREYSNSLGTQPELGTDSLGQNRTGRNFEEKPRLDLSDSTGQH